MNEQFRLTGTEHWTSKGGDVRLFMWNKCAGVPARSARSCSCTAHPWPRSRPSICRCRAGRFLGDGFFRDARLRHLVRRHGRLWPLHQDRDNNAPISYGADDCFAAATYIAGCAASEPLLVYGISSGALRAALFAQRHPGMVARLALDAMVWTGEGSPTLADAARGCRNSAPRTAARSTANSCARSSSATTPALPTTRDRGLRRRDPGARRFGADRHLCRHVRQPAGLRSGKITVPTLIMRGEYDGIASLQDLLKFFEKLPNPDKQFAVMPGIAHASFQQKNYAICYHILASFFSQPAPIYRGGN